MEWGWDSEMPAAHTQQKLTQVTPPPLRIERHYNLSKKDQKYLSFYCHFDSNPSHTPLS